MYRARVELHLRVLTTDRIILGHLKQRKRILSVPFRELALSRKSEHLRKLERRSRTPFTPLALAIAVRLRDKDLTQIRWLGVGKRQSLTTRGLRNGFPLPALQLLTLTLIRSLRDVPRPVFRLEARRLLRFVEMERLNTEKSVKMEMGRMETDVLRHVCARARTRREFVETACLIEARREAGRIVTTQIRFRGMDARRNVLTRVQGRRLEACVEMEVSDISQTLGERIVTTEIDAPATDVPRSV